MVLNENYYRNGQEGKVEEQDKKMSVKKIAYIVLGCIGLILGAVGAAVPMLPAFPFLLMAAVCFGKSSKKLDMWFKNTKLYKNNLEDYIKGQGMTRQAKIRVMVLITILMTIGFILMKATVIGRVALTIIWAFHMWYFAYRVKTKVVTE